MTSKIQITDFRFKFSGYGHYEVTFTSQKTGKQYTTITNNMPLIDATKNSEVPKIKDLNTLKALCKG